MRVTLRVNSRGPGRAARTRPPPHTGVVSPEPPDSAVGRRGVVRLLNTTGGRLLCLAGAVDAAAVDAFWRRYGREPARIDRIDARSVTTLSRPGAELLLDHVEAAELAGRPVELRPSPAVTSVLTGVGGATTAGVSRRP